MHERKRELQYLMVEQDLLGQQFYFSEEDWDIKHFFLPCEDLY